MQVYTQAILGAESKARVMWCRMADCGRLKMMNEAKSVCRLQLESCLYRMPVTTVTSDFRVRAELGRERGPLSVDA